MKVKINGSFVADQENVEPLTSKQLKRIAIKKELLDELDNGRYTPIGLIGISNLLCKVLKEQPNEYQSSLKHLFENMMIFLGTCLEQNFKGKWVKFKDDYAIEICIETSGEILYILVRNLVKTFFEAKDSTCLSNFCQVLQQVVDKQLDYSVLDAKHAFISRRQQM